MLARLLVALLLWCAAAAQAEPLVIRADGGPVEVGRHWDVLPDLPAGLSPALVAARTDWQRIAAPFPNFGLAHRRVWARLQVATDGSHDHWQLLVQHGQLERATMYVPTGSGWRVYEAGTLATYAERALPPHRGALFPFDPPAGTATILFQFESRGSILLPAKILSPEQLRLIDRRDNLLFGIVLGTLLAVTGYALSMYVAVRDSVYPWFAAFLFSYGLFQSAQFGLPQYIPFGAAPLSTNLLSVCLPPFSTFAALTLVQRFFDASAVPHWMTLAYRLIKWAAFAVLIPLILALLGLIETWSFAHVWNAIGGLSAGLLVLTLLVRIALHDWRAGILFTFGWILFNVSNVLQISRVFFAQPLSVEVALLVVQVGLAVGTITFSVALADRLRRQRDVEAAALRASEANLERVVAERTVELEQRNIALADVVDRLAEAKHVAEQANRSKSEFLAHMSHELRTPLNAIMGFSEIIQRAMVGDAERERPRYAEYAGHIHGSGRHLLSLIDEILDISRIEAGKTELSRETFDLGDPVHDCVRLIRPQAMRAGLTLEAAGDTRVAVRGDPRAVKQIVLNLLSNAVKFSGRGGKLTVRVDDLSGQGAVVVQDTGIGIPPDALARLFEPFSRGDPMVARRHEGTGLGLVISRKLARLMGGDLHVASRAGLGTTATLILPGPNNADVPTA